jgi:phage repressor protein C with HTH and peptisase S24 domain
MPEAYNPAQRRRALERFIALLKKSKTPDHPKGISLRAWCRASDVSPGVISSFLAEGSDTLTDKTFTRLASGAEDLLGRPVTAAEIQGAPVIKPAPVVGFVGAGAEVHVFDGDSGMPLTYITVPGRLKNPQAVIVRGDSMVPRYDEGNYLIYDDVRLNPGDAVGKECVCFLENGKMFVKRLAKGSTRTLWNLQSTNTPNVIEDQRIQWAAEIRYATRDPEAVVEV